MDISVGDSVKNEDGEELVVKKIDESGVPIVGVETIENSNFDEIDTKIPEFPDGKGTFNDPKEATGDMKKKVYASIAKFGPDKPWSIMEHIEGEEPRKRAALRSLMLHHSAVYTNPKNGEMEISEPVK